MTPPEVILTIAAVVQLCCTTSSSPLYATDFGTISKESLKRITKWGGGGGWVGGVRYFTHPSSCYPVTQTGMSFKDVRFMTPLPSDALSKEEEQSGKKRAASFWKFVY